MSRRGRKEKENAFFSSAGMLQFERLCKYI